jgi:hypothetical protein
MTATIRETGARFAAFQVAVLGVYCALAIVQTWPLVLHLDSHLPGRDLGDNAAFVWNLWWMREALASSSISFFNTDALFAPMGASLVLHTHTALSSWLGATVLRDVGVVRAQNLLLIGSLALNGSAGYLLARLVNGAALPAAIGGALLLVSPVVATRLMGHFNLVVLWPLVFGCAGVVWWRRRPSALRALVIGAAAGTLVYVDYYLTVYFLLFIVGYLLVHHGRMKVFRTPRQSRLARVAIVLAVVAFTIAAAIGASSATSITIASTVISLRTPTNALTAGWLLLLISVLMRSRWTFDIGVTGSPPWRSYRTLTLVLAMSAALIAAPLTVGAWELWRSGGYVTSATSIRSGPQGIDAGTVVMGPPFNGLIGDRVRSGYARLGIDTMESSAWVGLGLVILALVAWRAGRYVPDARRWGLLASLFLLWALGPSLIVFGQNTGLLLPQALARWIPIVNNARIPGRALLVVAICLSVLAALALERLRVTGKLAMAAAILVVAVIESLAAPLPLVALPSPGVYTLVAADSTRGAVLTVPFGVRDGFGALGLLEHEGLYAQTIHRHPIAGGFIARMPVTIRTWYSTNQPFATLMAMSEGKPSPVPTCDESATGLRAANVKYVVLFTADTPPDLREFVENVLPVRRIGQDDQRLLYEVAICVH